MLTITRIRHSWPEADGMTLDRPHGSPEYILLHYWDSLWLREGGDTFLTRPHAFHVISPHTPQWFCVKGSLIHDWIHITGDVAEEMARFGLRPDTLYYPKDTTAITALVHDLENEFIAARPYCAQAIAAELTMLFLTVSRAVDSTGEELRVDAATAEALRRLRLKVTGSLEEAWTVPKMAAQVSLSVSWFYSLYRATFGVPPMQDVIQCRIERARELLENSTLSVCETAQACGYANEYHFIRQFRQIVRITPKQYRLNHQREK